MLPTIARLPLLAVFFIAACTHPRDAARSALAEIEGELAAIEQDATRYAPHHLAVAEQGLAYLKSAFELKNYPAIEAKAPAVLAQAKALAQTVATNKHSALTAEWFELSEALPKALAEAEQQVVALRKGKRPTDLGELALPQARETLQEAQVMWAKALIANASGDLSESVARGRDAEELVAAMTSTLEPRRPARP